jgi:hypothetical protein
MKRLLVAMLGFSMFGCGAGLQDAFDAHQDAIHATKAGAAILSAGRLVGLIPSYTCGKPERVAASELEPALQGNFGSCATVTRGASTDTSDIVDVRFKSDGCDIVGAKWTGQIAATVSGGTDRSSLSMDFRGMAIDGHPVDGRITRTTCGDLDTFDLAVTARVPATRKTQELDVGYHGSVVDRPGVKFLGADFMILDGPAEVTYGKTTLHVVFHELWWEAGLSLPHKGELEVSRQDGHKVNVKFDPEGTMKVSIDGGRFAPVPVP